MSAIKILFFADTHLGFDLPFKPRVKRRRRGIDFFKNYDLALQPALSEQVDLVIHGGDLFYRSRIPEILISMAFEPLIKIADLGIPVVLVAGNHERSFIQQTLFEKHKNIFIFNRLRSFDFDIKNTNVRISGFPCVRKNIRSKFSGILEQMNFTEKKIPNIQLLCMHQAVEGAQVGVQNYTFRKNHDTIRAIDIPRNVAAVLSGHIHRSQVLTHGLDGTKMNVPVFYPGSIERAAFAERNESKGYFLLDVLPSKSGGVVKNFEFINLPVRPMQVLKMTLNYYRRQEIKNRIIQNISKMDKNSIVRIKLINNKKIGLSEFPTLNEIRQVLPATLNISIIVE